jgi:hypothetical protein
MSVFQTQNTTGDILCADSRIRTNLADIEFILIGLIFNEYIFMTYVGLSITRTRCDHAHNGNVHKEPRILEFTLCTDDIHGRKVIN